MDTGPAEAPTPPDRHPVQSRELREALILDLARTRPGFQRRLHGVIREAERSSPTCGDRIRARVVVRDGILADVAWDGRGCAVSTASAGVLSGLVPGTAIERLPGLIEEVRRVVGSATGSPSSRAAAAGVGEMVLFENFGRLPLRERCALLAWQALADAVGAAPAGDC